MQLKQIILIVGGILAIIGLALLPKSVVSNEDKSVAEESESTSEERTSDEQAPSSTLSGQTGQEPDTHMANNVTAEDQKTLDSLRSIYFDINQSSSIAHQDHDEQHLVVSQLANQFKKINLFDSAAYYLSLEAQNHPSASHQMEAAEAFYEASVFAIDPSKSKSLASKARSYYEKVLEQEPQNKDVKSQLAMTYVTTSNPMQGIQMLKEILEEDPNHATSIQNLGLLSIQSRQFDKAVERFERLLELQPEDVTARLYLGVSYKEVGAKEKAKEALEYVFENANDPALKNAAQEYLEGL